MYETLLGEAGFRKGMDLYFARHDGEAVTCDDFRSAMADSNEHDLSQFERWYSQAGTPTVKVEECKLDATSKEVQITLSQQTKPSAKPFVIPVSVGMLASRTTSEGVSGEEIAPTRVLVLKEPQQTFHVPVETALGSDESIIPSILRGFSAPVNLEFATPQTNDELAFLSRFDTDPYNRWAAAQEIFKRKLETAYSSTLSDQDTNELFSVWGSIFRDACLDDQFRAFALTLPSASVMSARIKANQGSFDPVQFCDAADAVTELVSGAMHPEIQQLYSDLEPALAQPYSFSDPEAVGQRSMRHLALRLLAADREDTTKAESVAEQATSQLITSNNMTDRLGAFSVLCGSPVESARSAAVDKFFEFAAGDDLVLDTWFRTQAALTRRSDTVASVVPELTQHADYDGNNPNKVRALLGGLMSNAKAFHQTDGSGYELIGREVARLAPLNPQLGSQLTRAAFAQWQIYDEPRQAQMKQQLETLSADPKISTDVLEVANKILGVELKQ